MRILLISAFYPPHVIGGWEQNVEDIVARLQERGHETRVLTSNFGIAASAQPKPADDSGIARTLLLESDLYNYRPLDFFLRHRAQLQANLATVRQAIDTFQPDVVFIHNMWNLNRGIAWLAENKCPGKVVYYVANNWPYAPDAHTAYWLDSARNPARRLAKRLLAPFALGLARRERAAFPLQFERVLTVSQAVRQDLAENARIPLDHMQVIHNGVELDKFFPARELYDDGLESAPPPEDGIYRLALVYAGAFAPHKGVHTAIEAMALLAKKPEMAGITLSLVGSGHPDYEERLRRMVTDAGLQGRVSFWPRVPREEMPELLRRFDVLVFPSIWEEPLARMMQEAMASGLVVVGTPTGGSPEALYDGQTGLAFSPGDAAGLAGCLEALARDPALRRRLVRGARSLVAEKFELGRMIDEIETALASVDGKGGACASSS